MKQLFRIARFHTATIGGGTMGRATPCAVVSSETPCREAIGFPLRAAPDFMVLRYYVDGSVENLARLLRGEVVSTSGGKYQISDI